jgi:hypothetical protein
MTNERKKQGHYVEWLDPICAEDAPSDVATINGASCKKDEDGEEWCSIEIYGDVCSSQGLGVGRQQTAFDAEAVKWDYDSTRDWDAEREDDDKVLGE